MTHPIDHHDVWPPRPARPTGWRKRAKCRGTDPDEFDLVRRTGKQQIAAALCAGCPVIRECAQDVLHYRDTGMVRAGTYLPDHAGDAHRLPPLIARLERIAGTNEQVST